MGCHQPGHCIGGNGPDLLSELIRNLTGNESVAEKPPHLNGLSLNAARQNSKNVEPIDGLRGGERHRRAQHKVALRLLSSV